jgi:hypothetical protein
LKKFGFVLVLFFLAAGLMAQLPAGKTAQEFLQEKGEVYFSFEIPEGKKLVEVFNMISVDNLDGNTVYAYANAREFEQFLALNLHYQVPHPGDTDVDLNMKTWEELQTKDLTDTWDFYPTYEAYVKPYVLLSGQISLIYARYTISARRSMAEVCFSQKYRPT